MSTNTICFLPLFLISCAASSPQQQQQPDWVGGSSAKYPKSRYLVGVGSGAARQTAENEGRANIGKIFKVDIKADIKTTRAEVLEQSQGNTQGTLREEVNEKIDLGLKKTLEGTEIAEVWKDPSGPFYALAVLERSKAAAILRDRMRELETAIESETKTTESTKDKLTMLRALAKRKSLAAKRESLNGDYRIVNPAGTGIAFEQSLSDLSGALQKFLKNDFNVGLKGSGPDAEGFLQTLTKRLTGAGMNVRRVTPRNESTLDVVITVDFQADEPTGPADEWYYTRWQLSLNAVDQMGGTVLVGETKRGKSGQLSAAGSKKRAVLDADKQVGQLAGKVVEVLLAGEEEGTGQ